jgi:GPH family glycoside/pentoside/hexuronide:cation symporter
MDTTNVERPADEPSKLSRKVKFGFGIGDLGGNLVFTAIGFYLLNFLTDSFGLAAGLAGTAFLIGKLWDAVTDPVVGHISDRTRTRWGRRRPYMTVGAILVLVFLVLTFSSPNIDTQSGKFAWILVIYCLLNLAYTLVNIPYSALTPELTNDFREQTVLNGYRMSFAVVGTITGAVVTKILVDGIGGALGNQAMGWTLTAVALGAIAAASTFVTILTIREQDPGPVKGKSKVFRAYVEVLKTAPFRHVIGAYGLHMTGVLVIQTSLIYYFRYVYRDEGLFTIALAALLVMALLLIPVWVKVSHSIGKKWAYNAGMAIVIVVMLVFFFLGARLPAWFAVVIFAVGGIGLSTNYVMPFSLMPDVVEYGYAESGVRREGVFYGLYTFTSKVGQALGGAITGWVLAAFAFMEPVSEGVYPVQSELTILGIRLLAGPIPAALILLGIIVLSFYPITRDTYEEILKKVKVRDADNAAAGE